MKFALALFGLVACGPRPGPAPLSSSAPPDQYIVWYALPAAPVAPAADQPAPPVYRSARLDADGHVLGERAGMILVAGGAIWSVEHRDVNAVTRSCAELAESEGETEPGHAHLDVLGLVEVGGARRIPLTQTEIPADTLGSVRDLDASHAVIASIGPYVFVQGATDQYACGAHGSVDGSAAIIDARTGAEVRALSKRELAAMQGEANRVVGQDFATGDNDARFDDGQVAYAASRPRWRAGALHIQHLFYASTCYACGNGAWDSYTWGTWIDGRAWPRALDAVAPVPPAVAAWIEAHPGAAGVSWADAVLAARAVP